MPTSEAKKTFIIAVITLMFLSLLIGNNMNLTEELDLKSYFDYLISQGLDPLPEAIFQNNQAIFKLEIFAVVYLIPVVITAFMGLIVIVDIIQKKKGVPIK